jgi:hypothetical protein
MLLLEKLKIIFFLPLKNVYLLLYFENTKIRHIIRPKKADENFL